MSSIADFELQIAGFGPNTKHDRLPPNPQSEIENPQSEIENPASSPPPLSPPFPQHTPLLDRIALTVRSPLRYLFAYNPVCPCQLPPSAQLPPSPLPPSRP